jgi:glycosyltransferase involved in cell wall biosynthesis
VTEVHVVVPGDIDDPAVPSGGNTYDRRICAELPAARTVRVRGSWPWPGDAARAELARALAALPDDAVVVADGLVACGAPDVVVPHARRLRLAVLVHMPLADDPGLEPELAAELDARERATLRATAAVVTTSSSTARRLVSHHGIETVHVAAPGTDPAPLAVGTDGVSRLLCVASVTPVKGHDLLIEALADVTGLPWSCLCAGSLARDPAFVTRLRRPIAALCGRLRLVGPLTGERLASAYDEADLVVLASRAETYGMAVTEALARGIPVVATAVGGVPETLGRTASGEVPGLLVPPGDADALAKALKRWLGDPVLRDRLRAAARERRGELAGWDTTARALSHVLDRLGSTP